jgi:hypothetical protein
MAAVVMLILSSLIPGWAGSVKKADLEELVNRSGLIFVGTCISVQPSQVQLQGQSIPVTRYTFKISDSIKGSASGDYILNQLGWPSQLPSAMKGAAVTRLPLSLDGLPEYQPTQEYLLMLTRPSSLGLSSPVGLSQSAFVAEHGSDGSKAWKNGMGNRGLFEGPSARHRRHSESLPGALQEAGNEVLPYREFIDIVREIARQGN